MTTDMRRRVIGTILGAILGFAVGAIVAVNVVITAGVDRGYEASLSEVFEKNAVVGVATVVILVAGPVVGVVLARRVWLRKDQ